MQATKYICNRCQESFDLLEAFQAGEIKCPRCSSGDVQEIIACSIEIGPPPWEYLCQQCGIKFHVQSPKGPDEAKQIRCPVCESKSVKWLALASEACPPGG